MIRDRSDAAQCHQCAMGLMIKGAGGALALRPTMRAIAGMVRVMEIVVDTALRRRGAAIDRDRGLGEGMRGLTRTIPPTAHIELLGNLLLPSGAGAVLFGIAEDALHLQLARILQLLPPLSPSDNLEYWSGTLRLPDWQQGAAAAFDDADAGVQHVQVLEHVQAAPSPSLSDDPDYWSGSLRHTDCETGEAAAQNEADAWIQELQVLEDVHHSPSPSFSKFSIDLEDLYYDYAHTRPSELERVLNDIAVAPSPLHFPAHEQDSYPSPTRASSLAQDYFELHLPVAPLRAQDVHKARPYPSVSSGILVSSVQPCW
jgi:hypothetical protein